LSGRARQAAQVDRFFSSPSESGFQKNDAFISFFMEAKMANDIDAIQALAECHTQILTKSAEQADRLRTLESRLAMANDLPFEGSSNELQKAVDTLRKSEAISAVLKGHSTKAGIDLSAAAMGFGTKSAIVSDGPNGSFRAPTQYAGIESSRPQLINRLRDLIPIAPATSGSVEWLLQTNDKQLAGSQYSADSPPLRDGAVKKSSSLTMTPKVTPVITLAHETEASRQVLSDNMLLLDFLRAELFDGVERELERQILEGDGTSGELDGLGNSNNYEALSSVLTGDTAADSIRRAIAQLQTSGFSPDAVILSPEDWGVIELSKTSEGDYVAGDPRMAQEATLWGVRVYASEYQTPGEFFVSAIAQSMRLWVRQEAGLLVSDSHNGNFTKNIVCLLAEARMALTISRGNGTVKGSL
jgi:HK97 family phage major capsid protein